MRVLFSYKDYFPVLGGIENHIRLLAEGLRQEGVDVRVLVTSPGRRTVREEIGSVPVVKAGRQLNVSSAPVSLPFLRETLRMERGLDIAHLHAPYPPGELAHLLLGRSRRTVITYHSDIVRQRVLGAGYAPILRVVLGKADKIIVSNPQIIGTSPFLQRVAHKCQVIPFGVDLRSFRRTPEIATAAAALRQQFGPRPLLLFIGRLRHYKGVDVLIRAMRQVDAHLLVIGSGPMGAAWQELVRQENLHAKVTFLGEADDRQALAARYAADLFVLPSTNRAETLGIVQLEAMACGLPLISTELGTGTSFVNQHGETGLVVPPNDTDALAAALQKLLADDSLRRRMGEAGQRRVAQVFSVTGMIQALKELYTGLLA